MKRQNNEPMLTDEEFYLICAAAILFVPFLFGLYVFVCACAPLSGLIPV